MATVLRCPECGTGLRVAAMPTAGQRVKCPKCGTAFAPERGDAPPVPPEPPRPTPAPVPPPAPAALSLPDEDEDAPPVRKPAPKPVGKPRRTTDADEDEPTRPAARKRRDEDDEEDDRRSRPTRKRKGEPKKSNGLLIGLIAGMGVVALLAVGGLVWALAGRKPDTDSAANTSSSSSSPTTPNPAPAPNGPNPAPNPAPAPPLSTKDLLEKTRRATALIRVEAGNQSASGSGFLVRTNPEAAYVVTNYHVISFDDEEPQQPNPGPGFPPRPPGFPARPPGFPARPPGFPNFGPPGFPGFGPPGFGAPNRPAARVRPKVAVVLNSGTPEEQSYPAEVVAIDPEADLATLRFTGARNVPAPLDVTQEAPVRETMPVRIFGFPGGKKDITIGEGKIIQLRRDESGQLNDVQIAGEIAPGNSGGPVVDNEGRLIGIAVATVRNKNIGFAIPAGQLDHMLKGSVLGGLVFQVRPGGQGAGELWILDRKSKVLGRDTFQGAVGRNEPTAPDEFVVLAALNDPMHKVNAIKVHFAKTESVPDKPGPNGWAPLPGAEVIALQVRDDEASARFRLPAGAVADETFAFQFSYVNADGQTVLTQPHPVRLSFPKNLKSVTLKITAPADDAILRYLEETIGKALAGGTTVRTWRAPPGLNVEINPVDDPKAIVAKINFGQVTAVEGRTISVSAAAVELPVPTEEELARALEDLKSPDKNRKKAGAERMAKVYKIVPDRREEIAKALEAVALEKDFWSQRAAIAALNLWAGPENAPGLIKLLDAVDWPVRNTISPILGRLKDPAAAPALAKLLPGLGERGPASAALKAIGPPAEKAVIPFLTHKDAWAASEACHILKEIGTEASVAPLQELLKGKPDFMVGPAANAALKAIQERKKAAPK